MKILNAEQTRRVDAYTIANEPILSIDLMERAAGNCFEWLANRYRTENRFYIFAGTGNNGGDALAIARLLAQENYKVDVFLISEKLSPDSQTNLDRLKKQNLVNINILKQTADFVPLSTESVIIDGLFGSGLNRTVEGFAAQVIRHINNSGATIISIDIPSGLQTEATAVDLSSENKEVAIVKANYTLTLEMPFLSFLFSENEKFCGELVIIPIRLNKSIIEQTETNNYYVTKELVSERIKIRSKFSHKGMFGHALLIAGSYGKIGAAVLAASACMRAGLGLLTLHCPHCGYGVMQTARPEVMLTCDTNEKVITEIPDLTPYKSIGIGPGIGKNAKTRNALLKLIENSTQPLVIDADALNILAENKEWLKHLPSGSIITPHVKEFERLTKKVSNSFERLQLQIKFAKQNNVIVVLKGAYTSTVLPDGKCFFNSTGNAGMATAGSGDVLTGIILSLLAQSYSSENAAIVGVYLHGSAGDVAASENGQEALIASDIVENLGKAFIDVKTCNLQEFILLP